MAGIFKARTQLRQPLVPHQHQKACFRLICWRTRIEAGRPVFDGVEAVAWNRLAFAQLRARERRGRKPLHRVAKERVNRDFLEHDRELILPNSDLQGGVAYHAARWAAAPDFRKVLCPHSERCRSRLHWSWPPASARRSRKGDRP